jgi:hypothetical protein
MEDPSRGQTNQASDVFVADRWLEDPPVQVTTTRESYFAYGSPQHLRADQVHFVSVMGMNDEFEGKGIVSFADLGVGDRVVVAWFPSDETGEALSSTVDEIEPEMIRQWAVSVCSFGISDEIVHDHEIIALHLAFDVENVHVATLPLGSWSSPRDKGERVWLLVG